MVVLTLTPLVESYAVLTRLPAPHALSAAVAGTLLGAWFPAEKILVPSRKLAASIVPRLVDAGIDGGRTYDALIALTASRS